MITEICFRANISADELLVAQEEHKRLEDTEKKSRQVLGDRLEGMLAKLDHNVEEKGNPKSHKLNIEWDELYVLHMFRWTQNLTMTDSVTNLNPSSNSMSYASFIFSPL